MGRLPGAYSESLAHPHMLIFFDSAIPYFGWLTGWLGRTFGRDETRGAFTVAFAAAGVKIQKDMAKYKGAYLTWWEQIEIPKPQARNEDLAKELWQTTESILEELGV